MCLAIMAPASRPQSRPSPPLRITKHSPRVLFFFDQIPGGILLSLRLVHRPTNNADFPNWGGNFKRSGAVPPSESKTGALDAGQSSSKIFAGFGDSLTLGLAAQVRKPPSGGSSLGLVPVTPAAEL